jgi:hypothetical protein
VAVQFEASCTAYLDNAVVAAGTIAVDYVPQVSYPDSLPNERVGTDVPRPNLLINGGFQQWQRGNGPFTAYGQIAADRWHVYPGGSDTYTISKVTGSDNGWGVQGQATHTVVTPAPGSGLIQLLKLTDGYNLASRTVSASCRISTATANAVRLVLYDATGGTVIATGAYHPGGSAWQTITVTGTVPSGCQVLYLIVNCMVTASYYICNAMLTVGTIPPDFVQLAPADDLARCRRYCIVHPASSQFPGQCISTQQADVLVPIPGMMGYPTMTLTGATGASGLRTAAQGVAPNTGGIPGTGIWNPGVSVEIQTTSSGGGLVGGNATSFVVAGVSSPATFVAEYNP